MDKSVKSALETLKRAVNAVRDFYVRNLAILICELLFKVENCGAKGPQGGPKVTQNPQKNVKKEVPESTRRSKGPTTGSSGVPGLIFDDFGSIFE